MHWDFRFDRTFDPILHEHSCVKEWLQRYMSTKTRIGVSKFSIGRDRLTRLLLCIILESGGVLAWRLVWEIEQWI